MRYRNIAGTAAMTALAALLTMGATNCQATESAAPAADQSAGPAGEVSVPLTVITDQDGTVVFVPIRINGRGPYDFQLDTGASSSMIGQSLSRRLHLPETNEIAQVNGVAGDAEVPIVALRRWTLGGQRLHGRDLPALDLGTEPSVGQVDGLLGSDELRRFGAIRIDYNNRRLVLRAQNNR